MMGILIQTELEGKINNLPHFRSEALLPVFEAVVNSIQAIEDRPSPDRGNIVVRIERDAQKSLPGAPENERPIIGFAIEDDGVGFDDANYQSFLTSDSTYKLARGCKGIGRFFWLKAFSKAEIESIYSQGGKSWIRRIRFTKDRGFDPLCNEPTLQQQKTTVRLVGYNSEYREQPSSFKTTRKIAQRILEHCLSFYISGSVPKITVEDEQESFSLDLLFDDIRQHLSTEPLSIAGHEFAISHMRLYSTNKQMHDIVLCGNRRDVWTSPRTVGAPNAIS